MSDSYDWNEFKSTGAWITFTDVGDTFTGTVRAIRTGADFNGNPCPELIVADEAGEEWTITAGQVMLKSELAAQAPQVGDKIYIAFTGLGEAKPGKAPAKQFKVAVSTAAGNAQPETMAAADPFEAPF